MYAIIVLNIMFSRNLSVHERLRENIISRRNTIMISGQVGIQMCIRDSHKGLHYDLALSFPDLQIPVNAQPHVHLQMQL